MNQILHVARTSRERVEIMEKLADLSSSLFNLKTRLNKKIDSLLSLKQKNTLRELARQQNLSVTNRSNLAKLLNLLKEKLADLPEINITLAIEPTNEIIDLIYNFYIEKYHKEVIWNITVDSTIIGGAIFGYSGEFKDYSLKKRVLNHESI